MGRGGTEVAKDAADMVLTDDDFATIVAAVEEGRRIYANIRRVVRYLLSTNAGEIGTVFLALLVGLPVPLLPLQILWINLVTDGSPAIALGLERADAGNMSQPPRPAEESILARGLWQFSLGVGTLMAVTVVGLQAGARAAGWPWQTMVFTTLAFMQLGVALSARSESGRSWGLGMRTNPWLALAILASAGAQLATVYVPGLNDVFGTEALEPGPLAVVLGLSAVPFVVIEASKTLHRRRSPET
jgi:Ca2+-transporting ATPase